MKKQIIITTIALGFIAAPLAYAERINLKELPKAVQDTITAQKPTDTDIKGLKIDREMKDGAYVYQVEFQEKGKDKKIWIAENGSLVKDNDRNGRNVSDYRASDNNRRDGVSVETRVNTPGDNRRDGVVVDARGDRPLKDKLGLRLGPKFEELPASVQAAVKAHGGPEQIADIDKTTRDGRTVYSVEFKEPGKNPKIWVAEDGSLVKGTDAIKESSGAEVKAEVGNNRLEVKGDIKGDALMLKDLPQAVQTTINRERGTEADVEKVKVQHETKDGRTAYKVQFEEKGKNTKLWVAEDGSIIKDSRK